MIKSHMQGTPEQSFRGKRMGFCLTLTRLKIGKVSVRPIPFPETVDALPPVLKGFGESSEGRVVFLVHPYTKEFQECLEQTCEVTRI